MRGGRRGRGGVQRVEEGRGRGEEEEKEGRRRRRRRRRKRRRRKRERVREWKEGKRGRVERGSEIGKRDYISQCTCLHVHLHTLVYMYTHKLKCTHIHTSIHTTYIQTTRILAHTHIKTYTT